MQQAFDVLPSAEEIKDNCPHCGAGKDNNLKTSLITGYLCGTTAGHAFLHIEQSSLCEERSARQKAESEVERLTKRMKEAEDIIKGLHYGFKKARKAHLKTCKNAQAEIDKLHTENVCLQELIQEFYEWTRRDYATEQEVREIMNRYHDLLNK